MFALNNWSPLQNANSVLFPNSSLDLRLITWCFGAGFVETDVAYTLQRSTGHSKGRCCGLHLPEGLVKHTRIQCRFTLRGCSSFSFIIKLCSNKWWHRQCSWHGPVNLGCLSDWFMHLPPDWLSWLVGTGLSGVVGLFLKKAHLVSQRRNPIHSTVFIALPASQDCRKDRG